MGRSHAWLPRGTVLVEPRPMNWGDNFTMVGAIRVDRWLTMATYWGALNTTRFVAWVHRTTRAAGRATATLSELVRPCRLPT